MGRNVKAIGQRDVVLNHATYIMRNQLRQYHFFLHCDTSDFPRDFVDDAPVRINDCWCLSHIFAGKGWGYLEDQGDFQLTPGCAVLIAPGVKNITAGFNPEDYREDFIFFGGELFDCMQDAGIINTGCFWLGNRRRLVAITELLRDVTANAYWQACVELQTLLLELGRQDGDENIMPVDALIKAIKDEPKRWWTLEEMAKYCSMSPSSTRRLLLRRTGLTPKPYAEGIKLRRAAEEIATTSRNIEDIARDYGYSNRFHFSRRFTAVIGVPPAAYREQLHKT